MSCSYCAGDTLKQSRCYLIENVRERFIPTYYHHPIFATTQPQHHRTRCTPTYHSQPINEGPHRCKPGKRTESRPKTPRSTYSCEFRRCRDETFYDDRARKCYNSPTKWYDSGKANLLRNLSGTDGYSK